MSTGGKRQALGRGLAALIPGASEGAGESPARSAASNGLRVLDIESIHPSTRQPRKHFDDGRLDEMAETIRNQGIIQPLVVRVRDGGGFELIAGERRWRAAQRAGLHEVPAVVREVAEWQAFEMALVENLQREDLNPIEEAESYQRMVAEGGYTQDTLSTRVGKDRSTIANALRLLKLPPSVRAMVSDGRLGMGHARALLGLDSDQAIERLARQTTSRSLSVRQVESLVKRDRSGNSRPAPIQAPPAVRDLVHRLEQALATRVRLVQSSPKSGRIEIHYASLDELDAVLAKILR